MAYILMVPLLKISITPKHTEKQKILTFKKLEPANIIDSLLEND